MKDSNEQPATPARRSVQPDGSTRPWTHEQETREMLRPLRRTEDVNGTTYCRGCGMIVSQCDCWDTVNGDV